MFQLVFFFFFFLCLVSDVIYLLSHTRRYTNPYKNVAHDEHVTWLKKKAKDPLPVSRYIENK